MLRLGDVRAARPARRSRRRSPSTRRSRSRAVRQRGVAGVRERRARPHRAARSARKDVGSAELVGWRRRSGAPRYDPQARRGEWQARWADASARHEVDRPGAGRRTTARDVPVSLRAHPHGARAQLHDRRRDRAPAAHARLQRPASDRLGRLRPAGGERRDPARRASGALDATTTSPTCGRSCAAWASATTGLASSRPATRRTTAGSSASSSRCSSAGSPTSAEVDRQLVRALPDRARERAGRGRHVLALRRRRSRSASSSSGSSASRPTPTSCSPTCDRLAGWPERVVTMQRNWIGRSAGAEIRFPLEGRDERDPRLHDASRHALRRDLREPRARASAGGGARRAGPARRRRSPRSSARVRAQAPRASAPTGKEGVFTGACCRNPFTGARLPIYASRTSC